MFPWLAALLIGLVIVSLVWLALRMLSRSQVMSRSALNPNQFSTDTQSKDAVIILQPGGRVDYMSPRAKDFFGLRENEPYDLERLARYVRPSDDFLEICSVPNSKRVSINGKLVELASFEVPGVYPMMLVSLRGKESLITESTNGNNGSTSNEILQLATSFSQSIASSLDLNTTFRSIVSNVSKLVPSDVLELKLWDEERKMFMPYRSQVPTTGRLATGSLSQFGSLTEKVSSSRQPLIVENVQESELTIGELITVQSYLGIPLIAGGELVGVLEAGQLSIGAFGQHDLDLLVLISGQAAVAIRNARLYEDEQRRRTELTGLANLNQSLGSIRDAQDMFNRLVQSISPLFQTEIVGFLIYDEDRHTLEGKNPFNGLPEQVVEIYRTTIAPDSTAEKIISSHEAVISMDAITDEKWRVLGLADVATAASLRENALIPLLTSGRMLGYLQVGHHTKGVVPFNQEELRLMHIVANQAAAIIENLLLVQQARARAQRADALRRVASLATSSANLDEKLKYSMRELANLFQADKGAIFLLDETRGVLSLNRQSAFGVSDEVSANFQNIFVDDPNYRYSVSGSQKAFISGRLSTDRRVLPAYRSLTNALGMESAIVAPLIVRERSVGELMIGSSKVNYFNPYDLQIVSTAAGQIASAIEAAGLMEQTDDSLRRRVDQLSVIARVSKELGVSLDVTHLLQVIHTESMRLAQADSGTVILFEPNTEVANPQIQTSVGHEHQPTLNSAEHTAIKDNAPIIVSDFIQDGIYPPYDGARSGIILPITHHAQLFGLINVYSSRSKFFNTELAELMQMLAVQAGIAISNAQRYQNEKQRSELMRSRSEALVRLTDVSYSLGNDQPLDQALQVIARGIRDATPFRAVLISVLEPEANQLKRVTAVGLPQETLNELMSRKTPLASVQQMLRPEFKISRSYFIPVDQTPVIPPDLHHVILDVQSNSGTKTANSWDAQDFLFVPLENAEGQLVGLISLDDPSNGLRPDSHTIEAIEAFASQAALLINNTLRQGDLRTRMESLSSALNRQQKLLDIAKNDLPILLHKDLEQTISLHNLDRRAQRMRAGLAITESVSRQLDANSALLALGRETLTQLGMSVALVAENTLEGPRLVHSLGSLPRATNIGVLFGQRNPLRATLQNGKAVLIPNLDEDDEWRDATLLTSLRAKGVICLPIIVDNKIEAAMLALSPEPMQSFSAEDRQVYSQISQQTSLILQNIKLLDQTRRRLDEVNLLLDFSRQLSGLESDAIVKSLLDSARKVIQNAHAGAVLVWNQKNETLTPRAVSGYLDNESMLKINYRLGEALPGNAFMQKRARRVDEINFPRDYNLSAENLSHYRQATGGRLPVSSLLIPITSNEQNIGLLVLDNFNATGAFRNEDEALLFSLSQQVALSMDNLRLVRDTQERAGQLQALNDASAALTSSLSSDQLINALLDQLRPILPYDTATLWLREKEKLTVASTRGFSDVEQRLGLSISVADSTLFKEMGQTAQPILVKDVREDPRFPPVEAPRLSWLGIPLISKGEMVGALAVEKWQANYFTREQIQVGLTFASQSAVSLDNARLYEDSVSRATELDQRSQRLTTLNRFTSALTRSLETDQIFNLTAEELLKGLNAKRVSVVTFERGQAYWKISTPRIRAKLPRVLPDAPIFSRLRESLGMFNTDDVRNEPDLASLIDMFGENTTALLTLPLASQETLVALFFVQMVGESRFGINELEIARTIINQATIALENARLYQSSVRTADRFLVLNETSSLVSASLNPEEIYHSVHKAAERLLPLDTFVITLLDESANEIDPVYLFEKGKRFTSPRVPFGKGMSSDVITSGKPILMSTTRSDDSKAMRFGDTEEQEVQSIVAVPMILGGKALGMLSAQSYLVDVYTEEDMQILGTLANQAIVAIQNSKLFAQTQKLVNEQEAAVVERTAQLNQEKQNTDTLLRILTEVSSSLDLDRTLNRTLSLLNDTLGAEQGTILLVNPEDNLLHYRAGYGYLSDRISPSARSFTLKIGEGLAGWVVKNREAVLVEDLYQDSRWVRSDASGQDHRSAIVVPMMVGEDAIGVLMVFHRRVSFFNQEMLNLVKAIATQVSVAINNANLYELIRDQAERLGTMLRKEQVEASRSQAILEAVADGVLVTGPDSHITFVNSSTVRILEVEESRLLGSPLDLFAGLASAWIETISRWSSDPSSYQLGEMYAEQLTLENGRIILVHLAPVILQNDFLGTVSIFRDITREVEVDRLKSEFVATVSHELRTPMTAIKGYVDILTMGAAGALNENQMHFLDVVRNNIERLNTLVSDLLDISRIESGRVTLNLRSVKLHEIAEEVVTETLRRSQAENKPMALSVDAPKNLPPVSGDTDRVRQILSNLVNNAYNYTPENGTIHVNIHQENGDLQVDVEDNGIGIKQEDQARLFERFHRGEHPLVLATPGTGLGLPIVRQLVEMHKGKLWMKSTGISGEGSTFSFTLPIEKNGA